MLTLKRINNLELKEFFPLIKLSFLVSSIITTAWTVERMFYYKNYKQARDYIEKINIILEESIFLAKSKKEIIDTLGDNYKLCRVGDIQALELLNTLFINKLNRLKLHEIKDDHDEKTITYHTLKEQFLKNQLDGITWQGEMWLNYFKDIEIKELNIFYEDLKNAITNDLKAVKKEKTAIYTILRKDKKAKMRKQ